MELKCWVGEEIIIEQLDIINEFIKLLYLYKPYTENLANVTVIHN